MGLTHIGLSSEAPETAAAPLRVVLAGNPNAGKSSLFNGLTGARQHVANYPGVTVEKRAGRFQVQDTKIDLVDLPGTYSLGAYTPEERIAEEEILRGAEVVVVVADSTQLRRHLVLLAQILQTGANLVLCLNMSDEARAKGMAIDRAAMEQRLGFPVVETEGHKGRGLAELRMAIIRAARHPVIPRPPALGEELNAAVAPLRRMLATHEMSVAPSEFVATRLIIGHEPTREHFAAQPGGRALVEIAERERQHLERISGQDVAVFVTGRYFGFVDGLLRSVLTRRQPPNARDLTDRIDSVVVHPWLGLPIFALVMYGIFWFTFRLGEAPMGWIEAGVSALSTAINGLWAEGSTSSLRSLIVDGVIAGVGGVIVFLPNILLLFLGLAFLEDTGYMARAAFLSDRLMHRFGLHGKSFIPMLSGFGCSIPGIMATRTLEHHRDRLVTILVLPLMSCGARLPIWMLLIPAFFPPVWRAPMLGFIYSLGIVLAFLLAWLLRRTLLRGEDAPFVMELPPYRLPTIKGVLLRIRERAWLYLHKAGTIILGLSVLLWAATSYPKAERHEIDARIERGEVTVVDSPEAKTAMPGALTDSEVKALRASEDLHASLAGRLGRTLEPVFAPLGFDWKLVTGMIGAFAAKEVFVAQMGIVYSLGESNEGSLELRERLACDYSPLVGLSLMIFLLIATPCMATVAVTRRESGSWGWALLQFSGLTGIAYLLALLVRQIGGWL